MSNFKKTIIRDKKHLRFVASLPCASCSLEGHSQAAHIGRSGLSLKEGDNLTLPMCCQRIGVNGCHSDSEKREKVYFERYGGVEKAKELANFIYENRYNYDLCVSAIKKFRVGCFYVDLVS